MKTQTIAAILLVSFSAASAFIHHRSTLPLDNKAAKNSKRDVLMPDIIPNGIHGGPPSAQWRGEGPVRDFEPREASNNVHVARHIRKFGAEWRGEPERIRAERRWIPDFGPEWRGERRFRGESILP
jgi:hypothetical protein